MKFLNWLGKAGKTSMVTLAGLGGVAAVAGVASWMYINNTDDSNSFNLGPQSPTNIVYSSGGNDDYSNYGGEREALAMRVSSRNVKLIEQEEVRQAQQEELAESDRMTQQAFQTSSASGLVGNSAYQGDKIQGFEGLNVGGDDPMKSLSGLGDMMAKVQAQANSAMAGNASAAGGEAGGKPEGAAAGFASQTKPDFSKSAALGGRSAGGGQGGGNQFVLQRSGKNKGDAAAAAASMPNVAAAMKNAQQEAEKLASGMRAGMASRASFGSNLDKGRGVHGGKGSQERAQALERLKFAQKRSAAEAANKHRAANTTAFLDGNQVHGGITVDGNVPVSTGAGQASRDFNSSFSASLGGIQETVQEMLVEEDLRDQERSDLKSRMWKTIAFVVGMMGLIAWAVLIAKSLPFPWNVPFWVLAAGFTIAGIVSIGNLWGEANAFANRWNENGLKNLCLLIGGLGFVGLGVSWWLSAKASTKMYEEGLKGVFKAVGASSGFLGGLGGLLGISNMGTLKR